MSHHAIAVARKLQNIAAEIRAFMQSPTFWDHFRAIHEDSDIVWEPDLLGDRLQRLLKEPMTDLRVECLVLGLGDVSRDLIASVKATIDYLNAASDFLNGSVPPNCPPRNVIPEEVCREYTLFHETPVDELLVFIGSIVRRLGPVGVDGEHDGQHADPPGCLPATDVALSMSALPETASILRSSVDKFAEKDAAVPPEFKFGPVIGAASKFSRLLSTGNQQSGPRWLELRHEWGHYFVKRRGDRTVEVWFKTSADAEKAKPAEKRKNATKHG